MQEQKDFFSKVVSLKTTILTSLVSLFVAYALISIIMLFASGNESLSSVGKIVAPLGIIAVGIILAIDCFYKMSSKETTVKVFAFITLILGVLDIILLTLMIWEIIPMYEVSGRNIYSFLSTPSLAYKIIMSLISITAFTFLGSTVLNIKENHKIIHTSKFVTLGFLASASFISVISNFIDFSSDAYSSYSSIRMELLQAISWIVAIGLGAALFYLSKTISWKEELNTTPIKPAPKPEPVLIAEHPIKEKPPFLDRPAAEPITEQPPVAPPPVEQLPAEPSTEQPPVEQLPAEPPVEEKPAEEPTIEQPPVNHIPISDGDMDDDLEQPQTGDSL